MSPTPEYLETLLLYYEEEVEGEAYFAELARRADDADRKTKLTLLAAVEGHAAEAAKPLIEKYGLSPRPALDLEKSGIREALMERKDWPALLAEMEVSYPKFVDAFRRLEAMGPAEDKAVLAFLTQHEMAAVEFLAREAERQGDSTAPLRAYLEDRPEARA
ncbi:hypothetical protein [Ovoidimarina sediminis]|uniref:hypothetical protein n=1 Tax=Ovoidimarina sediminis TaxID=3079856 RepID=UPI00290E17F6|nr:hypothetical protein [Rhodophyticola sp. MJ-SS7]MDU8943653.1 hypothetical protein [Rhodophyticola sp. MJ-SS7]